MHPEGRVAKDRCSSVAKCQSATKAAFAVGRLCLGDVLGGLANDATGI